MDIFERESKAFFQTYRRLPIAAARAEGCYIYDNNGTAYLDFLAGIAVNALGNSHPKIIAAACDQIEKFMHLSNYFYQEPQVEFAELLRSVSGFDRVFFTNSGTEAMDGAIKLARRWGNTCGKINIIGFTGGFHGRTYGALSIMDKPLYKDGMGPFLPNTKILPYNDSASLEAAIDESTAAIVIEFLQGEGGVVAAEPAFIEKIFELKNKFGFLLIADEVQSGTGRTGKFFCFEHYSVTPDIVTIGKGIGGGLPLGAILAKEQFAGVWEKGMHGTTYGGNAVACRTGSVVVAELMSGLMKHVDEMGSYFTGLLTDIKGTFPDKILEIRGKGLMLGLLLSFDAAKLLQELLNRLVIANATAGNVLRIIPPFIAGKAEIDRFCEALYDSIISISI